ncbi:MAG TPA: phosphatase PAP2 family protein [Polyangia bacterium]|nr:phosphatase PAP2 family protein [Polyangia bacterium]
MRSLAPILAAVTWLSLAAGARRARADEPAPRPAYRLSVDLDVPLVLVSGGLAASYLLLGEGAPPACAPLCNKANVNVLDRPFAGLFSPTWDRVGDVVTFSTLALVPLTLVVAEPSWRVLGDLLVVTEAALATSGVQVIATYAVGRPRPRVYGDEAPLSSRDNANAARSFISGHVANTVAVTLATTRALRRLERPGLAWTALGIGVVGSLLIGVARVEAGSHFPSDVLIGYGLGAGMGIAVPALHELEIRVAPFAVESARGLAITGTL